MTLRRLKTLLVGTALALALASPVALAWALFWPWEVVTRELSPKPARGPGFGEVTSSWPRPSLAQFERLWDKPLRRPLFDPPPPAPKMEEIVERPQLAIKLLGTIIEPGKPLAMLGTERGTVEIKGIGESVGDEKLGAKLVRIEPNLVVVSREDELVTLEIGNK